MKLDRLFLLIISTMGTVSVGIPIRSSQLGEDVSCRCCVPDGISSDSGGGGLAIREDQPDVSLARTLRRDELRTME